MVFMLFPNKLTLSAQIINWCVPFYSKPCWFSWIL